MSDETDLTAEDFDPESANDAAEPGPTRVGSAAYEALPEPNPDARRHQPPKRKYFKDSPQKRRMEAAVPGGMSLSSHQFAELLSAFKTQQANGATSPALEAAVAAITGLQQEVSRTVRRSNARSTGISAFSYPEGDYAAAEAGKVKQLKYVTYFCGGREREDCLTPTEVDLYNQFTTSKTCRDGRWTATIQKNGTKTELHVMVPCLTNDERQDVPPLVAVLGELLYGAEVVDPQQTMATILDLQKKIAALEQRVAVPA